MRTLSSVNVRDDIFPVVVLLNMWCMTVVHVVWVDADLDEAVVRTLSSVNVRDDMFPVVVLLNMWFNDCGTFDMGRC